MGKREGEESEREGEREGEMKEEKGRKGNDKIGLNSQDFL